MTKSTVLTDPDGVALDVAPVPQGAPFAKDAVAIRTEGGRTAWVSARELIAAIEEAAGLDLFIMDRTIYRSVYGADPEEHVAPTMGDESEPLWTEVRERPARAVKVTPELVRTLADTREHTKLAELKPKFSAQTGEPKGVEFFDPRTPGGDVLAAVGTVVILRPGQPPQRLTAEDFELMYEEVA